MATVMMALGAYRFAIGTAAYQQLQQTTEYRWESQERIGRHPAMQFLGAGHTTITLDGVVYPHFRSAGINQIEAMRAQAGLGVPLNLISGYGKIFGLFCIMSVDETQTYHVANGAPRKQEFTIELKSYGADGVA
jgi:phage protein U